MKEVPEKLEDEIPGKSTPETFGPPNAEPTGMWRVLRNSLLLIVAALVVGALIFTLG